MIIFLSLLNAFLITPKFLKVENTWIRVTSLFLLILFGSSFAYFIMVDFFQSKSLFYSAVFFLTSISIIFFIKDFFKFWVYVLHSEINHKLARVTLIIFILIFLISVIENLIYPVYSWDAIALYDIRGKFFAEGWSLRDMSYFVQFDPKNSYYYQLYPPFTSILHAWVYESGLHNVQIIYTVFYVLIVLVFLNIGKMFTKNNYIVYFVTVLCAFFAPLASLAKVAYTNIPFALFYLLGVFFLLRYIKSNSTRYLLLGGIFLAGSSWCRVLEPVWVAAVISILPFVFISRQKKLRKFLDVLILTIISGSFYFFWKFYEEYILKRPPVINTELDLINQVLSIDGIIHGFVALNFMYDAWRSYLWLIVVPFVLGLLLFFLKKLDRYQIFVLLCVLFNIGIYFTGTFIVSITTLWWSSVGDALYRSSLHILILGFLSIIWGLNYIHSFIFEKIKRKND